MNNEKNSRNQYDLMWIEYLRLAIRDMKYNGRSKEYVFKFLRRDPINNEFTNEFLWEEINCVYSDVDG